MLPLISPHIANEKLKQGALLIDIREHAEFLREHCIDAINLPLSALQGAHYDREVIFMCLSGQRTRSNAAQLAALNSGSSYLLDGGLNAWKQNKLATQK